MKENYNLYFNENNQSLKKRKDEIVILQEEIKRLKKEKNYLIFAHNYQLPEIQDIADVLGDSLKLAIDSKKVKDKKILFCGVDFMAETIKILNPDIQVFVPDLSATCPMANSLSVDLLLDYKNKYPDVPVVLYVNSTAETKIYADYVCTSRNACEVVSRIKSNTILFGPDKNLANYVQKRTGKNIIPIPGQTGFCYVHDEMTIKDIENAKSKYENAKVILHPECPPETHEFADYIGSTGDMIEIPSKDPSDEYIIGTEIGMCYRLSVLYPEKRFYPVKENFICHNMKKNNLEKVLESIKNDKYEVYISDEVVKKAIIPINNMFNLMNN